jgi:hypothetical protein
MQAESGQEQSIATGRFPARYLASWVGCVANAALRKVTLIVVEYFTLAC